MSVLKAIELNNSKLQAERFNLSDIEAEAEAILAQARSQSRQLLTDTEVQCERMRKEARQEGHQQGREEGAQKGRDEGYEQAFKQAQKEFSQTSHQTLQTLQAALSRFDQQKAELLWRAEQETVAMAVAIAEKITHQIGVLRPETARETLKEALELVNRRSNVIIYVNSRDLEHLRQMTQKESILAEFSSIHFQADDAVEPGGCRLITENGAVDAQLAIQIERIGNELILASELHPHRRVDLQSPAETFSPSELSDDSSVENIIN